MSIQIQLENFSGPLDLLLHLIKTNEMDVYNIQMVAITEQYLGIIEQMKQLDLDVAGEFLLMAASLIHIKSRMLLPLSDDEDVDDGEDPRAELVRRLLEYQRYKSVAESLARIPLLGRDISAGHFEPAEVLEPAADAGDEVVAGIYQLAEAFRRLLQDAPVEVFHEVIRESVSVADHVQIVLERLTAVKRLSFRDIFLSRASRLELVVTFLATLELVKMRLLQVEQANEFGEIWLSLADRDSDPEPPVVYNEEAFGYG